jgi:ATP-dependent helicase HrpB
MIALPIDPLLPAIVQSLRETPTLVLEAPPGAGKTTRVPRALLDAGFAERGEILVLEPRRLAARLAARRVAEELGEALGERVGYQVRFEDVSSARTRVRFVTEGVLTRRILSDPRLSSASVVVLDEFHERHLQGDVALALVSRLRREHRPDLAVVAMSATLDAAPLAAYLGAPTLRAEGRLFPIRVEHDDKPDDRPLELRVASAVRRLAREGLEGDVLVFLPGAAEIRRAREACEALAKEHDLLLLALHGDLTAAEQDAVVRRADRRKIILSTNVAESSVTIDGVAAVVDSGLARVAAFSPWTGLPSLRVEPISRASATQRAGRAGRTQPGRCLRLYTAADFERRREHDAPEIQRLDLTQTCLELASLGATDLAWLDPPHPDRWAAARTLLERLDALDASGRATETGKRMLRLPVHPRVARVVVEAERRGVAADGCALAAILSERDIRVASRARLGDRSAAQDHATDQSDLTTLLDLLHEARASELRSGALRAMGLDAGAVHAVERARKQLERLVRSDAPAPPAGAATDEALGRAVLAGFPDRVAKRRKFGSREFAVAGGGLAELSEQSVVRNAEWIVAVDAEERRAGAGASRVPLIRLASAIEPEWLLDAYADRITETTETTWNADAERVEAVSKMAYEGLVLAQSAAATGAEVSALLAAKALERGPAAFCPPEEFDRWLARARLAASVDPNVNAPSDEDVRARLTELCEGRTSFRELREAGLLDLLKSSLHDPSAVDRLAPERITLASGRAARVEYETGKAPWLESYMQDFFGMKASPRVGGGRIDVVLHLLAPNKRAVQVTTDLPGFFERHYPAIRRELARKYPKHAWPEDTSTPVPMRRR